MLTEEQKQKLAWAKEQVETGIFDGLSTYDVGRRLREAGLDTTTCKAFAKWFVERGMEEGWLWAELGLV